MKANRCPKCGFNLVSTNKEAVKREYGKAFTPWSLEDLKALKEGFERGDDLLTLVLRLERPISAVQTMVDKLQLRRAAVIALEAPPEPPKVPDLVSPL